MHDPIPLLLASLTLPGAILVGMLLWLVLSLHRLALRFSLLRGTTHSGEPSLSAGPFALRRPWAGPRERLPRQAEA